MTFHYFDAYDMEFLLLITFMLLEYDCDFDVSTRGSKLDAICYNRMYFGNVCLKVVLYQRFPE